MSKIRDQVIELIQSLPEDCTFEDIQYHLEIRRKVEEGIKAVEEGLVVSQKDAERRVAEWVKSSGPNPR